MEKTFSDMYVKAYYYCCGYNDNRRDNQPHVDPALFATSYDNHVMPLMDKSYRSISEHFRLYNQAKAAFEDLSD